MWKARTRRRLATMVIALVSVGPLLAGCEGSGPSGGSQTPVPTPSSQAFDNTLPCPRAHGTGVPTGAGCLSWVEADLDGDGRADRFEVYATLDHHRMPREWFARAVTASGPTPAVRVPRGPGLAFVYPRVAAILEGSEEGLPKVLVKVSAILYHVGGEQIFAMFGVDGGRISLVHVEGERLLVFPVGGISGYGDGALCTDGRHPDFVIRHVQRFGSLSKFHYVWTDRAYSWKGNTLVPDGVRRGRIPMTVNLFDPRIRRFYELKCGPVQLP